MIIGRSNENSITSKLAFQAILSENDAWIMEVDKFLGRLLANRTTYARDAFRKRRDLVFLSSLSSSSLERHKIYWGRPKKKVEQQQESYEGQLVRPL